MENLVRTLSEQEKKSIEELAGVGATEEDIAAELKIPLKHLQENYSDQLSYGSAKGRNDVLKAFYKHVQSGTNVTSISLWVKSRCGWRDTGSSGEPSAHEVIVEIAERQPCPPKLQG
jgi:hypothetical protein